MQQSHSFHIFVPLYIYHRTTMSKDETRRCLRDIAIIWWHGPIKKMSVGILSKAWESSNIHFLQSRLVGVDWQDFFIMIHTYIYLCRERFKSCEAAKPSRVSLIAWPVSSGVIGGSTSLMSLQAIHDNKFHGAYMGPIWGRQDSDGSHVVPMKLAFWDEFRR